MYLYVFLKRFHCKRFSNYHHSYILSEFRPKEPTVNLLHAYGWNFVNKCMWANMLPTSLLFLHPYYSGKLPSTTCLVNDMFVHTQLWSSSPCLTHWKGCHCWNDSALLLHPEDLLQMMVQTVARGPVPKWQPPPDKHGANVSIYPLRLGRP